jgi:hypothetical protein
MAYRWLLDGLQMVFLRLIVYKKELFFITGKYRIILISPGEQLKSSLTFYVIT